MSQPSSETALGQTLEIVVPGFGKFPGLRLYLNATREAENRLIEAKTVSPVTYSSLEHTFNESYRELKKHMASIGMALANMDKTIRLIRAEVLLDKYPDFLAKVTAEAKEKKIKVQDSADHRESFLIRDLEYQAALDQMAMLKAVEASMEGKIKVMENVSRYMRKQMDLVLRAGY